MIRDVNAARPRLGTDPAANSPAGLFGRALGAVDAFGLLGGRVGSVAALLASVVIDRTSRAERVQSTRQLAEVERLARRIATFSADQFPVVVAIDDTERFDPQVLDRLATALVDPQRSRVLVVVACNRDHPSVATLLRPGRLGWAASRFHRVDVDGGMGPEERLELIGELAPDWPPAARMRLTERTTTFTEVRAAVGSRLAGDIATATDATAAVDQIVQSVVVRPMSSEQATFVAWIGGFVHPLVYDAVVDDPQFGMPTAALPSDLRRSTTVVRVADSASGLQPGAAGARFSYRDRVAMAAQEMRKRVGR